MTADPYGSYGQPQGQYGGAPMQMPQHIQMPPQSMPMQMPQEQPMMQSYYPPQQQQPMMQQPMPTMQMPPMQPAQPPMMQSYYPPQPEQPMMQSYYPPQQQQPMMQQPMMQQPMMQQMPMMQLPPQPAYEMQMTYESREVTIQVPKVIMEDIEITYQVILSPFALLTCLCHDADLHIMTDFMNPTFFFRPPGYLGPCFLSGAVIDVAFLFWLPPNLQVRSVAGAIHSSLRHETHTHPFGKRSGRGLVRAFAEVLQPQR